MKRALMRLGLAVAILLPGSIAAQHAYYMFGEPSPDGIGKFYMGREISHVMGHLGSDWLERPSREREERTDLLLAALDLQPGDVAADIGAGTGFFSMPIAIAVGSGGRVLAVDIQPEMLTIIQRRSQQEGLTNIETILATETDPGLDGSAVDLVLLVDAYHEFSHPREVMYGVAGALSERGRVFLVEYRGEDPRVPIKPLHKMTVQQASLEMAAVGLELLEVMDVLPMQHIMVFGKSGTGN